MKNDSLGTQIKELFEYRVGMILPRQTYTLLRVDGIAFHNFTRGLKRPFDDGFMSAMNDTAIFMCSQIQGAKFAYIQSDEISILMTDFERATTKAWYGGSVQKIISASASLATAGFNRAFQHNSKIALFDSRVFTLPDESWVLKYFISRQSDASRNSIQMVARSFFSQRECNKKSISDLHEMLFSKGVNWNDCPSSQKRGRTVLKKEYLHADGKTIRSRWEVAETPLFKKSPEFLPIPIKGK